MLVLDNLRLLKIAGVDAAIRAAGAQLRYLPPDSPDYNPIEQVFAKLQALLRKAAARTVDDRWCAISALTGQFAPHDGVQYIRHAGASRSTKNCSIGSNDDEGNYRFGCLFKFVPRMRCSV